MTSQEGSTSINHEFDKLLGKSGIIHFQTEIDFIIVVKKYINVEITSFYDDNQPMIYCLRFLNESGREDMIEFWEDSIISICYEPSGDIDDFDLAFSFGYSEDNQQYIEFYIK